MTLVRQPFHHTQRQRKRTCEALKFYNRQVLNSNAFSSTCIACWIFRIQAQAHLEFLTQFVSERLLTAQRMSRRCL